MTVFAVPGGIRHPSRRDAGPSLGAAMGETPPTDSPILVAKATSGEEEGSIL